MCVYVNSRFLNDIEKMLGWRPHVVYKYLWKYVCLLAMLGLLAASLVTMVISRPTYTAWNHTTVQRPAQFGASSLTLVFPQFLILLRQVTPYNVLYCTVPKSTAAHLI